MKIRVNQERIKELLDKGIPTYRIAKVTNTPRTVVERIKTGKNIPYYVRKVRHEGKESKEGMCTKCGEQPIKDGNRYLCELCFRLAGIGEISPELNVGYW